MATAAEVTIAPAERADAEVLLSLLGAQLSEHHITLDGARLREAIDGVFADPTRGLFLLARVGRETIGVAYLSFIWALEHGGKGLWLEELYVVPAHRQAGVGTKLLEAILRQARQQGCAAIDLEVEADHQRAANLYQRHGFEPHQRQRWVRRM